MSQEDVGAADQFEGLLLRARKIRLLWSVRMLCLTGIATCAGSVGGWGIQHHHTNLIVLGALTAAFALAVMLLNWRLND